MITFSSFNKLVLSHSMLVDCCKCMLKSREWGPAAAVGLRQPPSLILHAVGIVSSCPYSVFFDTTTATHHSPIMYQIGGRGTTTHSELRLPSRQLRCRRGCSSSPRWGGIANCLVYYPTYSYVFLRRTHPTTTPHHPSTRCDLLGGTFRPDSAGILNGIRVSVL
jgi:hypothetical protein